MLPLCHRGPPEVERKPGGKKAWSVLEKKEKKPGVFFLGLKHIKINDEVKLTDYFNRLQLQPFDFKMFFGT